MTAAPAARAAAATVLHDLAPQRRIAHDAALADPVAADLELRLDHRQASKALGGAREHRRAGPWSAR